MTNTTPTPLVTVGVPVYNGAEHLAEAVESLRAQTLADFELLIADNASTDETPAICRRLAAEDRRIRVIRHERNIGAPRNWNFLVAEARGRYFKWASCNDVCAPTMLERYVEVLESDPSQVAVYGRTQLTHADGRPIEVYAGDLEVQMPRPSDRFVAVCTGLRLNNVQSGLVRTASLRRTGLDRLYPSGDMVLTAELALHGRIRLLPDVMLYRRHSENTFTSMKTPLQIQRMYDPQASQPLYLQCGRRHVDNIVSIWRAPIGLGERLRASAMSLRMLMHDRVHVMREMRAALRQSHAS